MGTTDSWRADTFERIYSTSPDPWRFATSRYERQKYAATLDALPEQRRFASAFEVGCSIGVLTARLAKRCDRLLAVDLVETPLAAARRNCAGLPHVTFERRSIPGEWPDGRFDLIVLSEVLYFLGARDVVETARRATASLYADGLVLLVNWTGPTDTPTTGDEAAELFASASGLQAIRHAAGESYRIDLLAAQEKSGLGIS